MCLGWRFLFSMFIMFSCLAKKFRHSRSNHPDHKERNYINFSRGNKRSFHLSFITNYSQLTDSEAQVSVLEGYVGTMFPRREVGLGWEKCVLQRRPYCYRSLVEILAGEKSLVDNHAHKTEVQFMEMTFKKHVTHNRIFEILLWRLFTP